MAEYIERGAALSLVKPDAPEDEKAAVTIATAKKLVRDIVRRTPAADVAPVVRCKDCEHTYESFRRLVCDHGVCKGCTVREDFFCADGAKREEAKRNEKGD